MQALNIIFGMREQFDAKVYGIVIQELVEEPGPLPTLFMRTVIQVVGEPSFKRNVSVLLHEGGLLPTEITS